MDVKSSWRKALEEDKAEKMGRSFTGNDSVTGRLTPLYEPDKVLLSHDAPSGSIYPTVTSHSKHPVSHEGISHKSSLLWDTFNTEALDSFSGTCSSAVHFSLEQETLPELPSCDSLLSLDDDALDMKSEDEDELLIPSLKTEAKQSQPPTGYHLGQLQQTINDSVMDDRKRTPECLLSDHMVSGLDRDSLMESAKSGEATDKVFSLDLDTLETASPPKKQEFSLPKLITFSPIDDMKC